MAQENVNIKIIVDMNEKETQKVSSSLSSVVDSLKKVVEAIGIAFDTKAVVDFGKTSVSEAERMNNALMKLQSTAERESRSFETAKKFIDEYVSDGLIPAMDAINAYNNLTLRGYDDKQIQQVMVALKDSATYGRDAGNTLGEAVENATIGLKEGNSTLLDNAGITKDVADMWQVYAQTIGTTVDSLTEEQKIQAEVAGIMEDTRHQIGDAIKAMDDYSGKVMQLENSFSNLKVAIGNVLIPVITEAIVPIKDVVDWLIELVDVGEGGGITKFIEVIASGFTSVDWQKINDSVYKLWENTTLFTQNVGEGLLWFFENVLIPLIGWAENNIVTEAIDALAAVIGVVNGVIDALKPSAMWLWENFLLPIAEWTGGKVGDAIGGIVDKLKAFSSWVQENSLLVEAFLVTVGSVAVAWKIVTTALDLWNIAVAIWNIRGAIAAVVTGAFGAAMQFLTSPITIAILAIGALIAAIILISTHWDEIVDKVISVKDTIVAAVTDFVDIWITKIGAWWQDNVAPWFTLAKWAEVFAPIKEAIETAVAEFITIWRTNISTWWESDVAPWFSVETWKALGENMKNGILGGFKAVVGGVVGILNSIIEGFEMLVNTNIVNTINALISGFNDFSPIKISYLSPIAFGRIPIPKLATGAVIPPNQEFIAILGDQKSGRNLEAPEGLIRQIMRDELSGMQGSGTDVTVSFEGSLAQLARVLTPVIRKEERRSGRSLIVEGGLR